jgi:hypothetical protein
MAGDERVRHCTLCDLNVYNFAAMTRDEVRELLMRTEGRVCARLYRRADGTLLTRDCPTGLRALRRRLSGFASTVMAALLSVAALASGCATDGRLFKRGSKVQLEVERVASAEHAAFSGVVQDQTGTRLPGVTVTVRNEVAKSERAAVTDSQGTFALAALDEGSYRVEVRLEGLEPAIVSHLALKDGEVTRAKVVLRFDPTESIVVGAIVADPFTAMGTTTFTKELIDKLPM